MSILPEVKLFEKGKLKITYSTKEHGISSLLEYFVYYEDKILLGISGKVFTPRPLFRELARKLGESPSSEPKTYSAKFYYDPNLEKHKTLKKTGKLTRVTKQIGKIILTDLETRGIREIHGVDRARFTRLLDRTLAFKRGPRELNERHRVEKELRIPGLHKLPR